MPSHLREGDPEEDLLRRLRSGEGAALAALAERHGARIRAQAERYLDNREDAEEVVQDVLVKVWRHLARFREDAALTSWIYRITFNTAMSHLRRRNRAWSIHAAARPGAPARTSCPPEPATRLGSAEEATLRRQFRSRFEQALAVMPAIYRTPVMLRHVEELSIEDASRVLQLNQQTFKSRVHRGRRLLRRHLVDFRDGLDMRPPSATT